MNTGFWAGLLARFYNMRDFFIKNKWAISLIITGLITLTLGFCFYYQALIISGVIIIIAGVCFYFSLLGNKTFFGTLFGVLLAFTLAQFGAELGNKKHFERTLNLLNQQETVNLFILKKMRRAIIGNGVITERLTISNLEDVLKDPIFIKYGGEKLSYIALFTLQRSKVLNDFANYLRSIYLNKGLVSENDLYQLRKVIVVALHTTNTLRLGTLICLDKKLSKKDKKRKLEELFENGMAILQLRRTFDVAIPDKPNVFQVDIRSRQIDGKYRALVYEISKKLNDSEKRLDIFFEDVDEQKAIAGAEDFVEKTYKIIE